MEMDSVSGSSQITEIALQACLGEGNSLFQEPAEGRGQSAFSKRIYRKQFLFWPSSRSRVRPRSHRGTLSPPYHLLKTHYLLLGTPVLPDPLSHRERQEAEPWSSPHWCNPVPRTGYGEALTHWGVKEPHSPAYARLFLIQVLSRVNVQPRYHQFSFLTSLFVN